MRIVWTLLIALWASSLTACAWLPTRTIYETVAPPVELLERCEPPELSRAETPRDVALRILALRQAWADCNVRHDALVNWIVGNPDAH